MRTIILCAVGLLLAGCTTTRTFDISSKPPGATIKVDGAEVGKTPLQQAMTFGGGAESFRLTASRIGYAEQSLTVTRETPPEIRFDMKAATRSIRITVDPLPAIVKLDGSPLSPTPVQSITREVEFTVDAQNRWIPHILSVERPGFQKMEKVISGDDKTSSYDFPLQPLTKSLNIVTTPPGASVYLDDRLLGKSPLTEKEVKFTTTDPAGREWNFYTLKIVKPGYEAVEQRISWDDGQTDYARELKAISKTVKFITNPAGSLVNIDGKDIAPQPDGTTVVTLPFPPDDNGQPKKYAVTVSRKTANSEWEPVSLDLGWDDRKTDYEVTLKEIRTVWVDLLTVEPQRSKSDDSWQLAPKMIKTLARKDVAEGASRTPPLNMTAAIKRSFIDSLSVSRDGQIVFTVLELQNKTELRSFLKMVHADGAGGIRELTDGTSLDLQPSFTPNPGQKEIVFASDRGGKRHNIWKLSADGNGGFTQLTNDQANDLWPSIDPAGMLFFQRLIDNRSEPRIYMTEVGKALRIDATSGTQPRISPDKASLLVGQTNDRTGKRDLLLYKIHGDKVDLNPVNLTRSPDTDEFDAAWSPDSRRIALVADRGVDEDKRHNFDIWVIDINSPENPVQVTTNGSWDDCPGWSPDGQSIYFRSNRGGEWAIWRVAVPQTGAAPGTRRAAP